MLGSVLISGGAGFLGRHLAGRILSQRLSDRVCVFSRDEHKHSQMRQDFGEDERLRFFLGDVRDRDRLELAMRGVDIVIHAAALKSVATGETNPTEMTLTNINGTANAIHAAINAGVEKFLLISSDKSVSAANLYGGTKFVAERMTLAAGNIAGEKGPRFSCCRYGNIQSSTRSLLPIWRGLIAAGVEAMPCTAPTATRFWMDISEAVDLILWTLADMAGGEVVIPRLPAFQLSDLADALNVKIRITGLGVGEKLHETLISEHEFHEFGFFDGYWIKGRAGGERLQEPMTSDRARRMTVEELRKAVGYV